MKYKKIFKKKSVRISLAVFLFIVILFIVAQIVRKLSEPVANYLTTNNKPAQIVQLNTAVSADLYFNDELGTTVFSDRIATEISQAQKTLEIAVYSLKSPRLRDAIYSAANRGVKVTLVLDFRKKAVHDEELVGMPSSIKRLDLGEETGDKTILMHHKFAIIDRGESSQKLIFGSYNWTELQEKYDPSFVLITDNTELIKSFGREFERLAKEESGPKKLHDKKYNPWDLSLSAAGSNYEVWFGPGIQGNSLSNRIYTMIHGAKQEIRIMIWDFTDKGLASEIIARARDGVKVTIITDNRNFNNKTSVFQSLQTAKEKYKLSNLEIISDAPRGEDASALAASSTPLNNASSSVESLDPFLHYHLLIVDNQKIFFGTNNWSRAGAYFNDESAIVTDDQKIIKRFNESFEYNYQKNHIR
ncbi:MAG: phospholipase D-like domain-containing protein [Candidatus Falkowbacteria bacterium]